MAALVNIYGLICGICILNQVKNYYLTVTVNLSLNNKFIVSISTLLDHVCLYFHRMESTEYVRTILRNLWLLDIYDL
jgi:hypothetical protein